MGEFLKRLRDEWELIHWIVETENISFDYMGIPEIYKFCVQSKVLCVVLKYVFRSYGIHIKIPMPTGLEMDLEMDDWDCIFENMERIRDVGANFDYNNFSLLGFQDYYLGSNNDEISQSLSRLPMIPRQLAEEKTLDWLKDDPEIISCHLLYHPFYKRLLEWNKYHIMDNDYSQLLLSIENRLKVIHNCSLANFTESYLDGIAFPIYYEYSVDYLYDLDESTFHADSIFAAFILQCLITVAEKKGFSTKAKR